MTRSPTFSTTPSFNGVNLVDGTSSSLTALVSADGASSITIDGEDLSLGGSIVTISSGASLSTASAASTMIGTINTSLENVNAALARLGSSSKQISIQNELHRQADRHVECRYRQSRGRGLGDRKCQAAILAGETAARRTGIVDRQLGAGDCHLVVQVRTFGGAGSRRPRRILHSGFWDNVGGSGALGEIPVRHSWLIQSQTQRIRAR